MKTCQGGGGKLSKSEQAEPVASCWEQASHSQREGGASGGTAGRHYIDCCRRLTAPREPQCWCGDDRIGQNRTAISSGPACSCREAPSVSDRKDIEQKQNGWHSQTYDSGRRSNKLPITRLASWKSFWKKKKPLQWWLMESAFVI